MSHRAHLLSNGREIIEDGGPIPDTSEHLPERQKRGKVDMQRTKEYHLVPEQESGPSEPKRPRHRKSKSRTSLPQEPDTTMLNTHEPHTHSVHNPHMQNRRLQSASSELPTVGYQGWRDGDGGASVRDGEREREQPFMRLGGLRLAPHDEGEVEHCREGRGRGLLGGRGRGGLPPRPATRAREEEVPEPRQTARRGGLPPRASNTMQTEQESRPRQTARLGGPPPRGGYQSSRSSHFQPPLALYNPISAQGPRNTHIPRLTHQHPRSQDFTRPINSTNIWGPNTIPYISAYDWTSSHPDPRHTVPPYLLDPAHRSATSIAIMKMWIDSAPSASQKREVAKIVHDVYSALKQRWPKLKGRVDVFGSCSWGGECGDNGGKVVDLDLMYRDFGRPKGYTPDLWGPGGLKNPRFPAIYNVHPVADGLRNAAFTEVQPIKFASTPIVKFKDPVSQISLDLNINDLGGWYNSSLMLAYCRISPYILRPLIHFVKLWAKRRNLNDAAGARGPPSFSSYALGLMCIGYLQSRGLLPNLQDPERVRQAGREECYAYVGWNKPEGTRLKPGFVDELPPGDPWKASDPDPDIGQVVRGFFDFYREAMAFQKEEMVLDRNQWTTQTPPGRPDTRHHAFSVLHGGWVKRGRSVGVKGALANDEEFVKWESEQKKANGDASTDKDGDTTMNSAGPPANGNQQTPKHNANAQPRRRDRNAKKEEPPASADGQPWNWAMSVLVVQDPFLHEKNCTRAIDKETFLRASTQMDRTTVLLDHAVPPFDEILEVIEPPLTKAEKKASRLAAAQTDPPGPSRPSNTVAVVPNSLATGDQVPEGHTNISQNSSKKRKKGKAQLSTEKGVFQ